MYNITIISHTEEENYILRKKVSPMIAEFKRVSILCGRPQSMSSYIDQYTNLVLLNSTIFSNECINVAQELRNQNYWGPVIMISKADGPDTPKDILSLANVAYLNKPYSTEELHGLVRKTLYANSISQQAFRRFSTSQSAEIEFFSQPSRSMSKVLNLSKGGAYFELPDLKNVGVGEVLRMRISLSEVNRRYAFPVKVVWTAQPGSGGGFGVGVQFLGPGQIEMSSGIGG